MSVTPTTADFPLRASAADWLNSSGMAIHPRGEDMASSFKHITVLGAGVLVPDFFNRLSRLRSLPTTSATLLKQAWQRFDASPRHTQQK